MKSLILQMKSNEIPNKLFPFFLCQILWSLQSFNVLNHSNPPLQVDAQFCPLGITGKVNPWQPCRQLQTFLLQKQLPKPCLLVKAPAQSPTPTCPFTAAPPCLQKLIIPGSFQAVPGTEQQNPCPSPLILSSCPPRATSLPVLCSLQSSFLSQIFLNLVPFFSHLQYSSALQQAWKF